MKVTPFDPMHELIIVPAQVWGRARNRPMSLVIDTGSSETVIDSLGYSPSQGEAITTVRSAVGKEQGYTLRVARFAALGFDVNDFAIHVFDLSHGVDGLSFLKKPNYEIRSLEGRILDDHA